MIRVLSHLAKEAALRNLFLTICALLTAQAALSQQEVGTIVVFRITPDHAVIAADSKAVRRCPSKKEPIVRNSVCKIVPLSSQLIFAESGYEARFDPCEAASPKWNLGQITKELYRNQGRTDIRDFATRWAQKMGQVLQEDLKISPPSHTPDGTVVAAVFVGLDDGRIVGYDVIIRFLEPEKFVAQIGSIVPDGDENHMGVDNVLSEFDSNRSARARRWRSSIDKLSQDDQIPALAKLQAKYDTSGTVGGSIDSIRLTTSKMEWLTVKPECDMRRKK